MKQKNPAYIFSMFKLFMKARTTKYNNLTTKENFLNSTKANIFSDTKYSFNKTKMSSKRIKKNKDTLVPSITSSFLLAFTPLESNMVSKSLVLKHKHTGNSNYEEKRYTNIEY